MRILVRRDVQRCGSARVTDIFENTVRYILTKLSLDDRGRRLPLKALGRCTLVRDKAMLYRRFAR